MIANREELKRLVRACVRHTAAVDVCSGIPWRNLVAPRQTGPDALLTDEALLRLAGRYLPESPDAQGVYHALFLEHSPIGADAQRALAAMKQWGLNPAVRNLDALRAQWKALHEYSRVSDGLDAAGVSSLAVRVGLFEDDAPELSELDERLHAMLDVTPLFALEDCWTELASRGASDRDTLCALIASRGRALAARSLYVGPDARWDGRMVEGCLLPTCRELGVRLVLDGLSPRRWRVEGARQALRGGGCAGLSARRADAVRGVRPARLVADALLQRAGDDAGAPAGGLARGAAGRGRGVDGDVCADDEDGMAPGGGRGGA